MTTQRGSTVSCKADHYTGIKRTNAAELWGNKYFDQRALRRQLTSRRCASDSQAVNGKALSFLSSPPFLDQCSSLLSRWDKEPSTATCTSVSSSYFSRPSLCILLNKNLHTFELSLVPFYHSQTKKKGINYPTTGREIATDMLDRGLSIGSVVRQERLSSTTKSR